MRAYISGRISKDNELVDFILTDFWFASPDYDGDLKESEKCILISGVSIDSVCRNKIYYARWKGIDVNGREINSIKELNNILKGKHLINGMGYFNEDVDFSDISVGFEGFDGELDVPYNKICNEIQFIV